MPRVKKSLSEAVSKEIKSKFDLSAFKDKKGLKQNVKFKEKTWTKERTKEFFKCLLEE